jgi:hypothetical protein
MDRMKIKWVADERDNFEIGHVTCGSEYEVTSTLGNQLIGQGFAVEVKPEIKHKTEVKTKGGK